MKKYFYVLFLIILITPSIAFASWWNPFSWFKKNPKPVGQPTVQVQQSNISIESKQKPTDIKVSETKIFPKKTTGANKKSAPEIITSTIPPTAVTTNPPVFDVCKNIEGIQTIAPAGMNADNGNCFIVSTNTNQQITQIQNSLNQIVQNTAPVPKPPEPAVVIPEIKEISNEEMGIWQVYQWSGDSLWIATADSQKGDVVTLKIDNQEYTKTVDNLSGRKHTIWSGFNLALNNQEQYPATMKLQRGNTFTIMNFTIQAPLMPQ